MYCFPFVLRKKHFSKKESVYADYEVPDIRAGASGLPFPLQHNDSYGKRSDIIATANDLSLHLQQNESYGKRVTPIEMETTADAAIYSVVNY